MSEPPPLDGSDAVLLLSGGMDSTALAAWVRPAAGLFIDYGQRPANSEERAAAAVADALGIRFDRLSIDLSPLGSGLLLSEDSGEEAGGPATNAAAASQARRSSTAHDIAPSPEWWPLRNQFLCSIAAAWALSPRVPQGVRIGRVLTATVMGDGARHVDGTAGFYEAIDAVTRMQEGGIRVLAPAASLTAEELVVASGVTDDLLGWTHSCHRSPTPCTQCPGCWKREQVLVHVGRLGYEPGARPVS